MPEKKPPRVNVGVTKRSKAPASPVWKRLDKQADLLGLNRTELRTYWWNAWRGLVMEATGMGFDPVKLPDVMSPEELRGAADFQAGRVDVDDPRIARIRRGASQVESPTNRFLVFLLGQGALPHYIQRLQLEREPATFQNVAELWHYLENNDFASWFNAQASTDPVLPALLKKYLEGGPI